MNGAGQEARLREWKTKMGAIRHSSFDLILTNRKEGAKRVN
jgi:hypothetical protein